MLLNLLVASAIVGSAKAPVRIMCIGDSITQGRKGKESAPDVPPTYSYRYPLFCSLVDSGASFKFVGGHEGGFEGSPVYEPHAGATFENVHEAYWGWPTWEVATKVEAHAADAKADIALIMLGGNDKADEHGNGPTLEAMARIVKALRSANPRVTVLLGVPFPEWKPFPEMAKAFTKFAGEQTTGGSQVIPVEQASGWVSDPKKPDTCTVDWVHPNGKGDRMLAQRFFKAMTPFLSSHS